jgi:hypothetical protein
MKLSRLGKFKFFRWFTAAVLGWKWSKNLGEPNTRTQKSSKNMIPRIWSS